MDDESIVALYWARNEAAIAESAKKYGAYCTSIARNILQSRSDAEECVNDTWLRAWNAMPPDKPSVLAAFLGRITRNLSFDVYKRQRREKRGGTGVDAVLDELAECVSGLEDTERQWTQRELREEIDRFLLALSEEKRCIFILRLVCRQRFRHCAAGRQKRRSDFRIPAPHPRKAESASDRKGV